MAESNMDRHSGCASRALVRDRMGKHQPDRAREIRVGRSQSIQRQTQYQLLTSERLNPISVRKLLDLGSQFNRL